MQGFIEGFGSVDPMYNAVQLTFTKRKKGQIENIYFASDDGHVPGQKTR